MKYIKYDKLCRMHATWLLKVREWSLMRVSFPLTTVAQKNRPLALSLDCSSLFFFRSQIFGIFLLKLLVSLKRNQLELEIVEKEGYRVHFPQHIQQITAIFSSVGHIWDSLDGRTFHVESKQSRLLEVPFDYGPELENIMIYQL